MGITFTSYFSHNGILVNNIQAHLFTPLDIPGCASWHRSDKLVTLSDGKVSVWGDQSGNGRNLTQSTTSRQPDFIPSGGTNNLPYFNLTQTGDVGKEMHWATNAWSALTAGDVFFVGQRPIDPPTLSPGGAGTLWKSTDTDTGVVPYISGLIYDFSLTNVRKEAIGTTAGKTASTFVYNVSSAANSWTNRLNGSQIYTTSTNTFYMSSDTALFNTNYTGHPEFYYLGKFYEFIMFNRILTPQERSLVDSYIYNRYGIVGV